MLTIQNIVAFVERLAPPRLAAEWDNVGLLVGDNSRTASRVMTCLTVTPASAREAIQRKANLIITHHPIPFHALRRLTAATVTGRLLLKLIAAEVAVYSPHTAWDSAAEGINQRLAKGLGLRGIAPLVPGEAGLGIGRWGWLADPLTMADLAARLKQFLVIDHMQSVGPMDRPIRTVAVGCGAAGDLLQPAHETGCDCLVLGEARFHTCLEAEALGMGLLLPGHFASERFAVESLAAVLAQSFPELEIWTSREERDPIQWLAW